LALLSRILDLLLDLCLPRIWASASGALDLLRAVDDRCACV
jgi:hypothetical protein